MKAFTGVTPADGGYAVPREIDALIASALKRDLPDPRHRQCRAGRLGRLSQAGDDRRHASGWVGETAARPETDTPSFAEIAPPMGELYANPAASQAMLDDAAFDVEGWLASEIAMEFARAEGAAFVSGNGVNQPKGFLQRASVAAPAMRRAPSARCNISAQRRCRRASTPSPRTG